MGIRDGMLGTVISIKAYGASPGAVDEAFAEVARIDAMMSTTDPGSALFALNRDGYRESVTVPPELYALLETAKGVSEKSGGLFDPTVGGVTALWKDGGTFARLPDGAEIAAALPGVSMSNVVFEDGSALRLATPSTQLDLGAIAKGYACERAADILKGAGATSALLDFGGNIQAVGAKPGADAWSVGVTAPYPGDSSIACRLDANDAAVVTSGTYQRFFESGGAVYHHILDPRTGYPADTGLRSVTIVCPSATLADALSTACFVMGLERGMALLARTDGAEGVFITDADAIHATPGLAGKLTLMDTRFTLNEAP